MPPPIPPPPCDIQSVHEGTRLCIKATFSSQYFWSHCLGNSLSKKTISQLRCRRMYMQSTTCRKCRCLGSLFLRSAERKKKVKVCSCWKSTKEMSSSRYGARMEQVFMGMLQFSITDLNSHTILASLFMSRFRKATYLLMWMARMSIQSQKMSFRDQSYLIRQALRRVTIRASRKEEMIPAKLFLQQERNSLMLFFRKRRDSQQALKYSSKLFCSDFFSSCILESLSFSILLRSVDLLMGAILNMEDSTFQMIFLIYLSSFCSYRLADRRRNCSPASFFISEFTFTFDISCMMASSSSYSSSSNETVGYRPFSGLLPPDSACISLDISEVMIYAALGLSILRMKISNAIFLLGRGSNLEKRSPRTDLLWNCAQNLLVICMRLQKGMQTTRPSAVTKISLSYNLNSPILRQSQTKPGSSCAQEKPAGILVIFSTTMQMLLADWMTSRQWGWMASLFSARRLLQGRKVSCCMHFFSIISTVTSSPFALRPYSKCISLQLTSVSPRTQSLICLPFCDCNIMLSLLDIYNSLHEQPALRRDSQVHPHWRQQRRQDLHPPPVQPEDLQGERAAHCWAGLRGAHHQHQ